MKDPTAPKVASVDLHGDGLIVTFDNALCAVYPHALLYAARGSAVIKITGEDDPELSTLPM